MIDQFTEQELQDLVSHKCDHCISVYMPAHRITNGQDQDRIRLKNLLDQAEQKLELAKQAKSTMRRILEPVTNLLENQDFWQNQEDGLAIFVSDEMSDARVFRLPIEFTELVAVDSQFHIRPLLPLLNRQEAYYLLALSPNRVNLYNGNRYELRPADSDTLPKNMEEALWVDDPERNLQFHTQTGMADEGGQRSAQFHGHAPDAERDDVDLLRYCRIVNDAVSTLLHGQEQPLLLAAVKELYPIYAEANTYPHLHPQMIEGNPDRVSEKELHKRTLKILQPSVAQRSASAVERFHTLSEAERGVNGVSDVITAAFQARVDTLFVAEDSYKRGTFSAETGEVQLSETVGPDSTDLLDSAVALTIENGGSVWVLPQNEMPDPKTPVSAILRF